MCGPEGHTGRSHTTSSHFFQGSGVAIRKLEQWSDVIRLTLLKVEGGCYVAGGLEEEGTEEQVLCGDYGHSPREG